MNKMEIEDEFTTKNNQTKDGSFGISKTSWKCIRSAQSDGV